MRDRLAGGRKGDAFFSDESLHRLASGDSSVLSSLSERDAAEFRKALENYKKIKGR